jgi:acetyl esterase/lipase
MFALNSFSQSNPVMDIFPRGTVLHDNIPYNNDDDPKQLLDIYLPANISGKLPLVIFIHGGEWLSNVNMRAWDI